MGAIGDILRVQHVFTVLGQECRNVFFYEISAESTGSLLATTIANAYAAEQVPFWQAFSATGAQHNRIIVDNLTDGLDFGEVDTDVAGLVSAQILAPVYAMNVTLPRTSKLTRNGSKRISGMTENQYNNGIWDTSGATIDPIVDYCTNSISIADYDGSGGLLGLDGVIVGRTLNLEGVYELDLSKINPYGIPILNSVATTQRTRKA